MESGNIVRGRIRRFAAIHGRIFNPCEPKKREETEDKETPESKILKPAVDEYDDGMPDDDLVGD